MTGRQKLERRISTIRWVVFSGFGLYLLPLLGTCLSPWFALVAAAGVCLCVVSLVLAMESLKCPECRKPLGNLLLIRQKGRMFALPENLTVCPHCHLDLDSHGSHEGLPEIMSAYEKSGSYRVVLDVPVNGRSERCEITLTGNAESAFRRILRLHPFGKSSNAVSYRYFYVPTPVRTCPSSPEAGLTVRVERDEEAETVKIPAPAAVVSFMDWLHGANSGDVISGFQWRPTQAADPGIA